MVRPLVIYLQHQCRDTFCFSKLCFHVDGMPVCVSRQGAGCYLQTRETSSPQSGEASDHTPLLNAMANWLIKIAKKTINLQCKQI